MKNFEVTYSGPAAERSDASENCRHPEGNEEAYRKSAKRSGAAF